MELKVKDKKELSHALANSLLYCSSLIGALGYEFDVDADYRTCDFISQLTQELIEVYVKMLALNDTLADSKF